MMKILGIDPGLKTTGYGIIEYRQRQIKLLETGIIQPKPKELIQKRIHSIYLALKELIEQHKPEILVLEKIYSHHKHPNTVAILGHVRGVVCLLCAQQNMTLAEHSVKRIRKALTGNGNATKIQTRRIVAHTLRVDEDNLTLDASDALALAMGYGYMHIS